MPSLKGYSSDLEYSYAPGVFPSLELMRVRPESATRLLLSERAQGEGVEKLQKAIDELQNAAEPDQISIDEVTDPAKE